MVKGMTRRVIVVKAPDPRLFEQAIFFVREDPDGQESVSAEQLLEEARRVAAEYSRRSTGVGRRLSRIPRPFCCAAGALLTAAVWALTLLLPL